MLAMKDSSFTRVDVDVCVEVRVVSPQRVEQLGDSVRNVEVLLTKIGEIALVEVVLLPKIGLASVAPIDATA